MLWSHRWLTTATQFLLLHWRESQTGCSLFWTLQHVWSLWLRSTSVVCHGQWPALADCSSEDAVQARSDGPSLSSAPGSKISHPLLISLTTVCLCLKFPVTIASTICQASSTVCSTCSLQHVWKLCFFCRQINSLNSLPDDLCDPAVDSEHFIQH